MLGCHSQGIRQQSKSMGQKKHICDVLFLSVIYDIMSNQGNIVANYTHLYQSYKVSMVRITVRTKAGNLSNGSAFHIGDGWLATAAHVVNDGEIEEIVTEYCNQILNIEKIICHSDERVDLAIIKTNFDLSHYLIKTTIHGSPEGFIQTDQIEIGGHLDDWIGDELVLSRVILMGYPPVPFANSAVLLASEGEVNAVIDKYNGPHPHFVISCMGRGGYSGGPVFSEYGFLLGVMTESLVTNNQSEELGYLSAISIEPLLVLLHEHGIYPGNNKEILEVLFDGADHWNEKT